MFFRVICVEENPVAVRGLLRVCEQLECKINRVVSSLAELLQALREEHFDLIISDSKIGEEDFFSVSIELKKHLPDIRLTLFTHLPTPTLIAQCVAHDFYDVVDRHHSCRHLVESIKSLGSPSPYESPTLRAFRDYMTKDVWPVVEEMEQLTRREVQIIAHLALGLNNRDIAKVLAISLETTKEHVRNILKKLNVTDRAMAGVWALKQKGDAFQLPL